MRYAVTLAPDDNGTILVTVPDIPEAVTFGDDRDDALARAVDAIETAIMGAMAAREDVQLHKPWAPITSRCPLCHRPKSNCSGHAGGWRRQGRACKASRRRIAASGSADRPETQLPPRCD